MPVRNTRPVGLARESSAVAAKELAYDYQVERLKEYGCLWVFGDRVSGTKDDRRGLEQALDKIRLGEANELVVTHLTRLGRSVLTINRVVKLLKQHDATLTVLGGAIDTSTPEGRAFLQSQAVWGEYEAELGAERQKIGWENTVKKGRPRVPVFGYLVVNGEYKPDTENREKCGESWNNWDVALELIAKFFELQSLQGVTVWALREFSFLKDEPRQRRPPFTPAGLKIWMLNPVLQGHVFFKRGAFRHLDRHPPLIGDEQVAEIKAIIDRRFIPGHRTGERRYAYSGLVRCGVCGSVCGKITTHKRPASQRKKSPRLPADEERYLYYRCSKARLKQCENRAMARSEIIDDAAMVAITKQAKTIVDWLVIDDSNSKEESQDPKILDFRDRIDRLTPVAEIDPRIKDTIKDLEQEIANLKAKAATPSTDKIRESAAVLWSMSDPDFWIDYTGKEKHDRLKHIIKQIVIFDGQVRSIEFQPMFSVPRPAPGDACDNALELPAK